MLDSRLLPIKISLSELRYRPRLIGIIILLFIISLHENKFSELKPEEMLLNTTLLLLLFQWFFVILYQAQAYNRPVKDRRLLQLTLPLTSQQIMRAHVLAQLIILIILAIIACSVTFLIGSLDSSFARHFILSTLLITWYAQISVWSSGKAYMLIVGGFIIFSMFLFHAFWSTALFYVILMIITDRFRYRHIDGT